MKISCDRYALYHTRAPASGLSLISFTALGHTCRPISEPQRLTSTMLRELPQRINFDSCCCANGRAMCSQIIVFDTSWIH